MSISPLNSNPLGAGSIVPRPNDRSSDRINDRGVQVVRTDTPTARPSSAAAPASRALPSEAPTGVDPELWSVLTTEERTHFAKLAQLGPLTYGRGLMASAPAAPAARGARLDIRI
jgi:hypothetical protein